MSFSRRLSARLAVSVAVAGLLVAGGISAGAVAARAAGGKGRAAPAAGAASLNAEVATVRGGVLSVADVATGKSAVIARGPYQPDIGSAIQDPGFSHDGRLVAYVETTGVSSAVHMLAVAGRRATTIKSASSYAWSPVDDDLAVALPKRLELISATGKLLRNWTMSDPELALFSPSGRYLAVSSRSPRSLRGYLHVLAVRTPRAGSLAKRLYEVRVAQSKAMNDFLPLGTLWTSTLEGTHAHELTSAGRGVADPVPISDGAQVIFVRMTSDRSAKVELLTVRTGVVHTIAGVDPDDYYGEFMASAALAVWQPGAA